MQVPVSILVLYNSVIEYNSECVKTQNNGVRSELKGWGGLELSKTSKSTKRNLRSSVKVMYITLEKRGVPTPMHKSLISK